MSNDAKNFIGRCMCVFGGSVIGSTITEIMAMGSVDYRAIIALGVAIVDLIISERISPAITSKNKIKKQEEEKQ